MMKTNLIVWFFGEIGMWVKAHGLRIVFMAIGVH